MTGDQKIKQELFSEHRWFQLPEPILHAKLSLTAKIVYTMLLDYVRDSESHRGIFPSMATISKRIGVSKSTVHSAISQLENKGYIATNRESKNNAYILTRRVFEEKTQKSKKIYRSETERCRSESERLSYRNPNDVVRNPNVSRTNKQNGKGERSKREAWGLTSPRPYLNDKSNLPWEDEQGKAGKKPEEKKRHGEKTDFNRLARFLHVTNLVDDKKQGKMGDSVNADLSVSMDTPKNWGKFARPLTIEGEIRGMPMSDDENGSTGFLRGDLSKEFQTRGRKKTKERPRGFKSNSVNQNSSEAKLLIEFWQSTLRANGFKSDENFSDFLLKKQISDMTKNLGLDTARRVSEFVIQNWEKLQALDARLRMIPNLYDVVPQWRYLKFKEYALAGSVPSVARRHEEGEENWILDVETGRRLKPIMDLGPKLTIRKMLTDKS